MSGCGPTIGPLWTPYGPPMHPHIVPYGLAQCEIGFVGSEYVKREKERVCVRERVRARERESVRERAKRDIER